MLSRFCPKRIFCLNVLQNDLINDIILIMKKIDGRYLKKLREQHGYTLREFAELVYSSKSSVQRWEKSFAPDDEETLRRIADVYGISVEEMFEQSSLKYGEKKRDPYALAELKFGTKWLFVAILLMIFATILFLVGPLLLNVSTC